MEVPEGFVDVSVASDCGVLKKVIREGSGESSPSKGCTVYVHYTGTLYGGEKHGEKFDSSRDRGDRFSFTLGENQVIKAWDEGVATMKKGELCELICTPGYAYGDKATGSIPANATLKFEIELFEWKGKDISNKKDGSLTQSIIVIGSGFDSPKDCATAKISIKGSFNDVIFEERDVEFEIGDCESQGLVAGIEMAVKKMKKNEHSVFEIGPQHAFGSAGNAELNIPPEATVSYEITLKDFDKMKESYSLESSKDKLQYSESLKARGTAKVRFNNFRYAAVLYEKAVSYLEYETDFTKKEEEEEDHKALRDSLLLSLHLNLSLCYLKAGDVSKTLKECDSVLAAEPQSEKALYRRGQALMASGQWEEACTAFRTLLSHHTDNKQAVAQLRQCEVKVKESLRKERELYRNMLSKLGQGAPEGDHGAAKSTEKEEAEDTGAAAEAPPSPSSSSSS